MRGLYIFNPQDSLPSHILNRYKKMKQIESNKNQRKFAKEYNNCTKVQYKTVNWKEEINV